MRWMGKWRLKNEIAAVLDLADGDGAVDSNSPRLRRDEQLQVVIGIARFLERHLVRAGGFHVLGAGTLKIERTQHAITAGRQSGETVSPLRVGPGRAQCNQAGAGFQLYRLQKYG